MPKAFYRSRRIHLKGAQVWDFRFAPKVFFSANTEIAAIFSFFLNEGVFEYAEVLCVEGELAYKNKNLVGENVKIFLPYSSDMPKNIKLSLPISANFWSKDQQEK